MKDDELAFMRLMLHVPPSSYPYRLKECFGYPSNEKRALYLLSKWSDKGWYNYGVSLDHGWLEPEGIEAFKKILGELDTPPPM